MTDEDTHTRLQKALNDIQALLDDPEVSARLDDETRAVLSERPNLLGWYPGQKAVERIEGIVQPLKGLAGEVENTATQAVKNGVKDTLGDIRTIVEYANNLERGVGTLAGAVSRTLVDDSIKPLGKEVSSIAKQIAGEIPFVDLIEAMLVTAEAYERRLGFVLNSLQKLRLAADGKDLKSQPQIEFSLTGLADMFEQLLKWLWDHSLPGTLIYLVEHPSLEHVIRKFYPVPSCSPDFLYVWLSEPEIDPEERDFRKQLVAGIDQYLREEQSAGALAIPANADAKTAINLVSELLSVAFSIIGGFAFRHPKVPSLTLPKLAWTSPPHSARRPFDCAGIVSTGISRSVSYSVKASVGTIGRGVWEVNLYNDAAVEGIATALSGFTGALIQTVLNDLFWLLEIREVYDSKVIKQQDEDIMLDSWRAVPEDPESSSPEVLWGVFLRTAVIPEDLKGVFADAFASNDSGKSKQSKLKDLRGMVQSYTAYMDAIGEYSTRGHGESDETISIKSFKKGKLQVEYACKADPQRIPVLKAYCHGAVAVLTPDSEPKGGERTYRGKLAPKAPSGASLSVRSNWGGSAQTPVG